MVWSLSKEAEDLMQRFSLEWTNQVKIDPEDILFLVEEMGRLHDERCETSWFAPIGILYELFPDHSDEPYCIIERMQCLIKLMGEDRMRGWTMKTIDPTCTLTNRAVFTATSTVPIRGDDNNRWFDADEFFAVALMDTPSSGSTRAAPTILTPRSEPATAASLIGPGSQ
jgi:hypothetical protein